MRDEEVVSSIQRGKIHDFGIIVDRYEKKMFWYIKKLINHKDEEVEDLTQEVFLTTFENIQEFDTSKKFSSWIYRIAHNKAVDFMKRKRFKTTIIGEEEEVFEIKDKLMEELLIEKEEREKVQALLEKLELKYREVIWLYYFEDKSQDEISDILRTSNGNVKIMIYRAKEKLRRLYEQN